LQGVEENPIVGRGVGEQGHRRPELQIIGVAKDLFNGSSLDEVYQPGAFGEPWTEPSRNSEQTLS
jgi:hypothetical protein